MLAYTKHIKTILLLSLLSTASVAQYKDESRFMDWSKAGADTSIRSTFTKEYNVTKYGIQPNGKTDISDRLRKIISKAKPYSIIYFPEGEYALNSSIDIPSNIIIRGAGIHKTKFHCRTLKLNFRGIFHVASFDRLDKTHLSQAATKGSTQFSVENTAGYSKGDIIEIMMENDPDIMYTQERWNQSWAATARGQILEVTEVNGGVITVDKPLRLDYDLKDKPFIYRQSAQRNIGFENFSIENYTKEDLITIYFKEARNCWVDNVYSINTVKMHVMWETSSHCSLTNSFFKGTFKYSGGGEGYGVVCSNHTSDCLVENNIFTGLRHSMMTKKGANGNVFVNNYSFGGQWDHGPRSPADISIHGHFSYMNLFEGNIVERITSADHWGPSGPGTTFLRNIVVKDNIEVKDKSIKQNVIANALLEGKVKIYDENIDPLNEGNQVNGVVENPKSTIPKSLYFQEKPIYFGNNPWPLTGSKLATGEESLPSKERYEKEFLSTKK